MSEEEIKDDAAEAPAAEEAKAPEAAATEAVAETPAEAPAAEGEGAAAEDAPKAPEKKRDIFAEIAGGEEEQIRIHKAKKSKNIQTGIVHITATFNNTLVSVTDVNGNAIGWSSAGKMGFRGSKKNTPYAAQMAASNCAAVAAEAGMKKAEVFVKGPGAGRESAIRTIQNSGIEVSLIRDITPMPHNGCRPPKRRRV